MRRTFLIVATLISMSSAKTFGQPTRGLLQGRCSGIDVTASPYRADPTGATDSAPAFNAAIAAAGGQTVCVPPGTYGITEDVSINNNNVNVNAPSGATILFKNSVQFFVRGSGNSVSNIHINCASTAWSGFVINGANNRITGCTAMNCGAHGFVFDGQSSSCSGNTITGCTSSNNGQIGIAQNHCSGNTISGNTCTSNMLEGITADNQADRAQITGNTLIGNCIAGGVGGIGVDFSTGVTVTNNVVQNTRSRLAGLKTQNNMGATTNLQVRNNRFLNNGGVGVWLFCNNGCTTGATVAGNTFSGNAATGNYCNRQVQVDNRGSNSISC